MLSIGKIGAGPQAAAYYADQVAPDPSGYYDGEGEAAGRWTGSGARLLGLDGDVTREQLDDVLSGAGQRRVDEGAIGGFDLTFRAPKSVSVLWAVADAATADEIRAGHDAAVADAMGYLEREACGARRGKAGVVQVQGDGFVSAAFTHRTSRAGDPLLHTHVVTGNLTRGPDQRWTALDGRHLYHQARTAGFLYQAALREQLTDRLGFEWQPVNQGVADVRGVSREVVDEFSQRRRQILERMNERAERSAAAAQVAALDTRQPKHHEPLAEQRTAWRARAAEHGLGREAIEQLPTAAPRLEPERRVSFDHLTETSSTFARTDVLRELADGAARGASVRELERAADHALALVDAVHVGEDSLRHPTYSTTDLLAVEQRLLERVDEGHGCWPARSDDTEQALGRRPTIGDDQAEVVCRLTQSRESIEVVRAPAGTGKTFALDAAREAWQQSQITVVGCALSARAALELEDQAGIPSTTIARLLHTVDDGHALPYDSVLVVDEAGMVGTRDLERLADATARARGKLVLVGDDRQLPEIAAGGAFHALAEKTQAAELREGRRQTEAWDRDALDALRSGEVERWARAYRAAGRITVADTAEDARQALVNDWSRAEGDAVMIAYRRADVTDLNARARALWRAEGRLGDEEVEGLAGRTFSAGDRVVATRNHHHAGLLNGQRATIARVDDKTGSVVLGLGDREVELGQGALQRGDVDHGYAITAHRAQGATFDRSFVLGSEDLYREWGYTALSRHRTEARFYIAHGDLGPDLDQAPPPDELALRLGRVLGPSRAERTASEQLAELTDEQIACERQRLADRLREEPLPAAEDDFERRLRRAHGKEQLRDDDLTRIDRLIDELPWWRFSDRKRLVERREHAQVAADEAVLGRELHELEHLEASRQTKAWRAKYEDLATTYVELTAEHHGRLELGHKVDAKLEKLDLSGPRLEAPGPRRELAGTVAPDLDGPDLGM